MAGIQYRTSSYKAHGNSPTSLCFILPMNVLRDLQRLFQLIHLIWVAQNEDAWYNWNSFSTEKFLKYRTIANGKYVGTLDQRQIYCLVAYFYSLRSV